MTSLLGIKEIDSYDIFEIIIENGILKITAGYSGGCEDHIFTLYVNEEFQDSSYPRHSAILIHNGNNDLCEACFARTR